MVGAVCVSTPVHDLRVEITNLANRPGSTLRIPVEGESETTFYAYRPEPPSIAKDLDMGYRIQSQEHLMAVERSEDLDETRRSE